MTFALLANANTRVKVVDAENNEPLPMATVFAKSGVILGLTDNAGYITISSANDFPITVRCLGYEPGQCTVNQSEVRLTNLPSPLQEVIVSPNERPINKIVCLVREYSSGITSQDTMQLYCEYMTVSYIVDGKVKGYKSSDARPSIRNVKRYARISHLNTPDSIFTPQDNDDICTLSWLVLLAAIPTKNIDVPESIKRGADCDSIPGKYGTQFVFRKKNNLFTKYADALSEHKDRNWSPFIFKLIGMTVDIDEANWTSIFNANDEDIYNHSNFIEGLFNIHMIGKGKWIKKIMNSKEPIELHSYLELIPVDRTYITVDEYKEERDNKAQIEFQYPQNHLPVSPAIQTIIERIESNN